MKKEGKLILFLFFSFCRSQRSPLPTKMLLEWEANTRSFKLSSDIFSKILKDNKGYIFLTWVF